MERVAPRDQTAFTSLPILGGIGVLRATYHSHSFSPHTHDTFAIGVFDHGGATVRCENRISDAGVSDVLVIEPGAVHSAWSPGGREWRYRSFYPSARIFASLVEESGATTAHEGFGRHVIHDPGLARRLKAALAAIELRDSPLGIEELLVSALRSLWAHTLAHRSPAPMRRTSAASLARAKEYIDSHTERHVSLADIAQVAGLSRYRLIRAFAERFGLTPYAYYMQRRIAEATHLLATGMGPAQVAVSCGFADQSHLTRHFKRLVGVTPGAYAFGLSHRPLGSNN
jgi:AraC-like DNA-binding protein